METACVDSLLNGAAPANRRAFFGSFALGLLLGARGACAQSTIGVPQIGLLRNEGPTNPVARAMVDALGVRVLQVHHRKQLAVVDRPRVNRLADLPVVCANCHVLIHADPRRAMRHEDLGRRLRGE
jgi:hypothetical protein